MEIGYYQKQLDKASLAVEKAQQKKDKHELLPFRKSIEAKIKQDKKRVAIEQEFDKLVEDQDKARGELVKAKRLSKERGLPEITDEEIQSEYPHIFLHLCGDKIGENTMGIKEAIDVVEYPIAILRRK